MNKKILLFAFALGTLGASAQSVTIQLNDGTSQKFCTDYIKEITLQEVQPEAPEVELTKLEMPWTGNNTCLKMSDASGGNVFQMDLYGLSDAAYLLTGTYAVGASEGLCVGTNANYSYVQSGDNKQGLKSGSVVVSNEGRIYTILVDVELVDGTFARGKYVGMLPKFSPFVDAVLTGAKFNDNAQPKGQFYVKFNDADWNIEMAVVFVADPDATALPAGTYNYADTNAPGTFTPSSYITIYTPYTDLKPAPGSVIDVAVDGTNYTMTMNFNYNDGRSGEMTFTGEIQGEALFTEAPAQIMKSGPLPYFKPQR